jgi:hypothetical protein
MTKSTITRCIKHQDTSGIGHVVAGGGGGGGGAGGRGHGGARDYIHDSRFAFFLLVLLNKR